jgi:hypothetical protein
VVTAAAVVKTAVVVCGSYTCGVQNKIIKYCAMLQNKPSQPRAETLFFYLLQSLIILASWVSKTVLALIASH